MGRPQDTLGLPLSFSSDSEILTMKLTGGASSLLVVFITLL